MSQNPHTRRNHLVITALISVQIFFGINYSMTKVLVTRWPPLVWASVRTILAAVAMMLLARIFAGKPPKLTRRFLAEIGFLSVFGIVLNQACIQLGLSLTNTTNASILTTLTPVFTLLLVVIRGQERKTIATWAGFCLALFGVLVLRRAEDLSFTDQSVFGDLLVVGSSASYAVFLTTGRSFLKSQDQMWATAWLFCFGAVGLTLLSLPYWQTLPRFEWTHREAIAATYVLTFGTLAPYFLSNWALARTESSRVALFSYLQPVVACAVAVAFLGEPFTWRTLGAGALIFAGFMICLSRGALTSETRRLAHHRHH